MSAGGIPHAVRGFVGAHIESVGQLEVLLLLHSRRDEDWTAGAVQRELRVAPEAAASRLADLRTRGLVKEEPAGTYRYAPTSELAPVVDALAEAYAARKVSVIKLIYSKPSEQVTTFADAFRFRRKDS
jgi:hypothetical protein